ncbi:DUF2382 domain-containing protein [Nostoc sp. CMAA1605]|uniref:DUF2382 domain-containing protein n=1 Tax=Nostoc sp. CMAA1605 TaxID=2055159 RepID=UPI001F40AFF3|nr:DUF2382 domain-containing protein [Nostoc sp. CMAA1605]MCF4969061.1 hypothetical protein [Nostoc sp. CMAA1605]
MTEYLTSETPNHTHDEEKLIRLLEERLTINHNKQKIGEVIVRKVIETQMIQVPVRREKLIVEQITPNHQQLAEIDLKGGDISGVELQERDRPELTFQISGLSVNGCFVSPKIASLLLNAIALEHNHGCQQICISIAVETEAQQKKYQEWFDRCSQEPPSSEK